MFDRPKSGERALLVQLAITDIDADRALAEFKALALSADADVVGVVTGRRLAPEAKYYVGLGKAEEIREAVIAYDAELVLINHELSPSQERNLERLLSCRVVSRSGLILDIFAQRARTFEGKLQVELAQLKHLSTRLIRGWTHLERQKGGIGLRGPGETQLETDRRLLRDRIQLIEKRLTKVRETRSQNRRARQKTATPVVSLVGYTNAGKSTLFNALTGHDIYVANQLFATLDPTMSTVILPGASNIILTDTVGFIRNLPHQLIEAFRSTLEETQEADLLVHVIDISDPAWSDNIKSVKSVLEELGVRDVPIIEVFNKIDARLGYLAEEAPHQADRQVWLSAEKKQGLDLLKAKIAEVVYGRFEEITIELSSDKAKVRAKLHDIGAVIEESLVEETGGWRVKARLSPDQKALLGL